MGYNAIVMAGGEGTRLGPLTGIRPKPNVYVAGKRAVYYVFDGLLAAGVNRIVVPVQYKSNHITKKMKHEYGKRIELVAVSPDQAVRSEVVGDPEPRFNSTTDCVMKTRSFLEINDGPLIIASADIITNMSVEGLLDAHRQYARKGAWATIASVKIPREQLHRYGVVLKDKDDRVKEFLEKRGNHTTDGEVNASFYVIDQKLLDFIEGHERMADFGKDVFPSLAKDGKLFSSMFTDAYWSDIGTPEDYLTTNLRMIDGIKNLESPLVRDEKRHCLIGKDCKLFGDVRDSVIGNDVEVDTHSTIRNSVLVGGNHIVKTNLSSVIVDNLTSIYGSKVGDGAVVGRSVLIDWGSEVLPGVKIDPNATVKGKVEVDITIPTKFTF